MDDIKEILEMFDTSEKWNAYIELSRMKNVLVNELESRLYSELNAIYIRQNKDVVERWTFESDKLKLSPKGFNDEVGICIEWRNWQSAPGYQRCVGIWIDPGKLDETKFVEQINIPQNIERLPIHDYERIQSNWFPFARKISADIFEVDDNITSYEECLFRTIKHPKKLAEDLWNDVFAPFVTEDCANCLREIVEASRSEYQL